MLGNSVLLIGRVHKRLGVLVPIVLIAVVVLLAIFVVPGLLNADRIAAGSLNEEHEHEALVRIGAATCGVERWAVKTGTDRNARDVKPAAIVVSSIFRLRSIAAPSFLPARKRIRPTELTVFSVRARLLGVREEQDSDFHLIIAGPGGRTMIAEIPAPACVGASSPFLRGIRSTRRAFAARLHPTNVWQQTNVKVRVVGVGYFDYKHGQSGIAPNGIELHPVLRVDILGPVITPQPTAVPSPPPTAASTFPLRVWVEPNPIPYGTDATVNAQTQTGASCTAVVTYASGGHPHTFDGSARTAGASGIVTWMWHAQPQGNGGTVTASCRFNGQIATATAEFTVTHIVAGFSSRPPFDGAV